VTLDPKKLDEALAKADALGTPSFREFAQRELGANYVVAPATSRNKERHEGATFVSQGQFTAVKEKFRKLYPEAARAYFGAF